MFHNLSKNIKLSRPSNAVAAGQTTINGTGVDMRGYDSVLFMVLMGAITAGAATSLKAQSSSDDDVTDTYADLAGTSVTIAADDDNQIAYLEITRPLERYVRPVVLRATQDSVVDGIIAIQYNKMGSLPITQTSTVVVTASKTVVSPAEGTP